MTVTLVHAPFDPGPLPRYTNLAYHPAIFAAAIERWFDTLSKSDSAILTLILHPDELMVRPESHPLYAFGLEALRTNLGTVLDMARQRRINIVGATTSEVIKSLPSKGFP